jgi:hypothetical protein
MHGGSTVRRIEYAAHFYFSAHFRVTNALSGCSCRRPAVARLPASTLAGNSFMINQSTTTLLIFG